MNIVYIICFIVLLAVAVYFTGCYLSRKEFYKPITIDKNVVGMSKDSQVTEQRVHLVATLTMGGPLWTMPRSLKEKAALQTFLATQLDTATFNTISNKTSNEMFVHPVEFVNEVKELLEKWLRGVAEVNELTTQATRHEFDEHV